MRAYELEESAVDELKNRLPKLKRHSYDTIDHLMQNISVKHKITGKKLHDMFVKKYGHTPDTWIKKIKNKLGEQGMAEDDINQQAQTAGNAIKKYMPGATKFAANTVRQMKGQDPTKDPSYANLSPAQQQQYVQAQKTIDATNADELEKFDANQSAANVQGIAKTVVNPANMPNVSLKSNVIDRKTASDYAPATINGKTVDEDITVKKVVFSGTGDDGGKYEVIQSSPNDYMIHANGKHIDTYSSLQRAMSVLKNEVSGLKKTVDEESKGLWANIHAKRERIKHGSGEKMRKPGSKGAPTADALKKSATEGVKEAFQNDEANLFYRYDPSDGRVKQKMISNDEERQSFAKGYRGSVEQALRVHNIIRSKFDNKKFIQKQGTQWVPVYPFGKPDLSESSTQKKSNVSEGVEGPQDVQKIKDFIKWSYKTLNMQKPYPRITISKNTEVAQKGHHTGVHKGNDIWVYVGNRNLIDIFRTIFHELTHHRQMQLNMIKDGDSYPGSPIEMLADMAAGKYLKVYGKMHPDMFQ